MLFRPRIQYHGGFVKLARALQMLGGIALAAAGLAIFFQKVDIHKLGENLLSLNPLTVIGCAFWGIMTLVFRAWRWKIMLPDRENTNKKGLFPIISIGFMLNNILPARLGEAARIVLLWKKNGYAPALCVGSIILERIFDTLAFMSCFFIPVFIYGSMKSARLSGTIAGKGLTLQTFAFFFSVIFFIACIVVFLYSRFPASSRTVGKKLVRLVPLSQRLKVQTMGSEILSNLDWIFSLKKVMLVILYTYGMLLCYAVMILILVNKPGFSILNGLFAQAFAAMGAAIPLAPGYVGTLHAVLLQGLLLCGLERDKAMVTTILYHAIPYCTITILGLYYFFKMRVNFKDFAALKKK
jgi:uncharacterized protein (TIRG00374 family)